MLHSAEALSSGTLVVIQRATRQFKRVLALQATLGPALGYLREGVQRRYVTARLARESYLFTAVIGNGGAWSHTAGR